MPYPTSETTTQQPSYWESALNTAWEFTRFAIQHPVQTFSLAIAAYAAASTFTPDTISSFHGETLSSLLNEKFTSYVPTMASLTSTFTTVAFLAYSKGNSDFISTASKIGLAGSFARVVQSAPVFYRLDAATWEHDGVQFGGNLQTFGPNRFGNSSAALYFNGVDNHVLFPPNGINLGANQYSMGIWFKSNNLVRRSQVLFEGSPHLGLMVEFNNDGSNRMLVALGNCNGVTWPFVQFSAKSDFNTNQWYSLALVKNGISYSLYFDGQLDTMVSFSMAAFSCVPYWRIGDVQVSGYSYYFSGWLDDVFFYPNKALTASEVATLNVGDLSLLFPPPAPTPLCPTLPPTQTPTPTIFCPTPLPPPTQAPMPTCPPVFCPTPLPQSCPTISPGIPQSPAPSTIPQVAAASSSPTIIQNCSNSTEVTIGTIGGGVTVFGLFAAGAKKLWEYHQKKNENTAGNNNPASEELHQRGSSQVRLAPA